MFLFTTPPEPPAPAPVAPIVHPVEASPVVDAIRLGAAKTGTDFEYLLSTARRESALDPSAKAPTSSATGLFQFIEQTWLGVVKTEGDKVGLTRLADAIQPRTGGGFSVEDPGTRSAILKLREDPNLASVMAGALTQQNREALAAAIGHEPSHGELYLAHLLGARGSADLIRAAQNTPGRPAALDQPDAAAANRSIFYDRDGRPRGSAEVVALLSASAPKSGSQPPSTTAAATPPAPRPAESADAPVPFRPNGPVLYSLFQTENRSGPISEAVAKVWRANNTAQPDGNGDFFPRSGSPPLNAVGPVAATGSLEPRVLTAAAVPLPPARPSDLVGAVSVSR